jgi:hypothetical protein
MKTMFHALQSFFGRASARANSSNSQSGSMTTYSDRAAITPQDDRPRFLTPDGKPCYGAEEKYHFILFENFRQFGDFINSWRDSTPFRLQELRDTRISYPDGELNLGPNYGRRYEIFYYQKKLAYYKSTPLGR